MPKYPCTDCPRDRYDECSGKDCQPWLRQYFFRQERINAYARHLAEQPAPTNPNVFTYPHPEEVRHYLNTDPCESCMCNSWCRDWCAKKTTWWQTRMHIARKKAAE